MYSGRLYYDNFIIIIIWTPPGERPTRTGNDPPSPSHHQLILKVTRPKRSRLQGNHAGGGRAARVPVRNRLGPSVLVRHPVLFRGVEASIGERVLRVHVRPPSTTPLPGPVPDFFAGCVQFLPADPGSHGAVHTLSCIRDVYATSFPFSILSYPGSLLTSTSSCGSFPFSAIWPLLSAPASHSRQWFLSAVLKVAVNSRFEASGLKASPAALFVAHPG